MSKSRSRRQKARQSSDPDASDEVAIGNMAFDAEATTTRPSLAFDTDDPEITGVRRRKRKKFKYAPPAEERQYTFPGGTGGPRTRTNYFWSDPHICQAKYIASLGSVVAIGFILAFLFGWLTGWLPFYPTQIGQYAAIFFILPLAIYIIGAAMWISESIEFFSLSLALQFLALGISTYLLASLFYAWFICINGSNEAVCVNPYWVDTVMFVLLFFYWAAGAFATGAHIYVVGRATRVISATQRYSPPN